jgi:hypothetical protein
MRVVAAVAALAAILHAGIGTTYADDGSGQLITRSFVALPTPLVVNVEPDDNTRTNMTLADRLARELGRRGYQVPSAAAPLVLRFDSEIRSNVTTAQGRYQREPSGAADSDMSIGAAGPPDRPVGLANILSSAPGRSVMGTRGSDDYSRPLRYVVNARIEDRSSGSVMWQGHASYDSDRSDADPILEAMMPLLAAEVGQTVRDRRFSLD